MVDPVLPPVTRTYPFASAVAVKRERGVGIAGNAIQIPRAASYSSASLPLASGPDPPTTNALPSGRRMAWANATGASRLPAAVQIPAAAPAGGCEDGALYAAIPPPATNSATRPAPRGVGRGTRRHTEEARGCGAPPAASSLSVGGALACGWGDATEGLDSPTTPPATACPASRRAVTKAVAVG